MSIICDSYGHSQLQQAHSDLSQVSEDMTEIRLGQWKEFNVSKEQEENEVKFQVHRNSV